MAISLAPQLPWKPPSDLVWDALRDALSDAPPRAPDPTDSSDSTLHYLDAAVRSSDAQGRQAAASASEGTEVETALSDEQPIAATHGTSDSALTRRMLQRRRALIMERFSRLMGAAEPERTALFQGLVRSRPPELVLKAGLADYDEKGDSERLFMLASLMENMGTGALPALEELARTGRPVCEVFVDVVGQLQAPVERRLAVLAIMAENSQVDVRLRVANALESIHAPLAEQLLEVLAKDRDSEVAEVADTILSATRTR